MSEEPSEETQSSENDDGDGSPTIGRYHVTMHPRRHDHFVEFAEELGTSFSGLIRRSLNEFEATYKEDYPSPEIHLLRETQTNTQDAVEQLGDTVREQLSRAEANDSPLSSPEVQRKLEKEIVENGPLADSELVAMTGLPPETVTTELSQMNKLALIEKVSDGSRSSNKYVARGLGP